MQAYSNKRPHGSHFRHKNRYEDMSDRMTETRFLTGDNASFDFRGGFLYITVQGEEEKAVKPCCAFPLESKTQYVCMIDEDDMEIGIVRDVNDFDAETSAILQKAIELRYYAPVITKVLDVRERYGFSYWRVETDEGVMNFTVKDTYHSIFPLAGVGLMIFDADGNRFEIPDLKNLDVKSHKKVELYL